MSGEDSNPQDGLIRFNSSRLLGGESGPEMSQSLLNPSSARAPSCSVSSQESGRCRLQILIVLESLFPYKTPSPGCFVRISQSKLPTTILISFFSFSFMQKI